MICPIDFQIIDKKNNEELKAYHDRAYEIFRDTLIMQEIKFNDMPVKVREMPMEDNKVQGFFHIISEENKRNKIRLYKDERVKYIPFIAKMITEFHKCQNCTENCSKIKVWTAPYLGKESVLRTKIFFEEYDYIVILEKRKTYYQLVTAYVVDRKDRREDLLKEYQKCIL